LFSTLLFNATFCSPYWWNKLERLLCNRQFLNVNTGTRDAERAMVEKHKELYT
jgi:hypothetical protein